MTAVNLHAFFEQHALVVEGLHREDAVLGHIGGIADIGHFLTLIRHVLGKRDAHEMPVAVEDQHAFARHGLARGDLEGREHVRQGVVRTAYRSEISASAIAAPMCARGDHDAIGAVAQDIVRRHLADAEVDLDVFFELGELDLPVRDDAAPFVQSRQRRHGVPMTPQLFFGLAKVHDVAALAKDARAFHAGGSAAHHQHGAGLRCLGEFFRMPSAPIFLADGHVLSAHDLAALLELGDADVAADAFPDVLDSSFGDFRGQEGVCDRGAGSADDVQHTGTDQCDHVVGTGEPAISDHGYARSQDRLALLDEGRHPAGFAKARRARVLAPFRIVADLQRDRVHHAFAAEQFEHSYAVLASLDALGTMQCVDLEACRDGARSPKSALEGLQQFDIKARPVGKAAAVAIRAPIETRFEKLARQGVVARGYLQEIESRLFGALSGLDVHIDHGADVELIHFAAVDRPGGKYRRQPLARSAAELARLERGRIAAAVPQLDAGKAPIPARYLGHVAQVEHVALIPNAGGSIGIFVGFGMDGAEFGEYRAPTAFGLHAPQMGLRAGPLGAGTGAV